LTFWWLTGPDCEILDDIERWQTVGHKFSLVLSREITDDESAILEKEGCAAIFGKDSLPTNAQVTVTRMDFDDITSPTLAEAIEFALETVKKVPDLSVPGLTVPAQPAETAAEAPPSDSHVVVGEVIEDLVEDEQSEVKAPV
jgi:hypothetical protein